MITSSFDDQSPAKLEPYRRKDAPKVDACIMTFSYVIIEYVQKNYQLEKIGDTYSVNGKIPVYQFHHQGKTFAFMMITVGAPSAVATIEDTFQIFKTDKYIVFGGSGSLNKEISHGRVLVPLEAYRDEGTSYHYAPPSDYIEVKNGKVVAEAMEKNEIPFVMGKTWTTDAIYRETQNNFLKHKNDGCISVEMECAALQALSNFRGIEFYTFFTCGDLLDAPKHLFRAGEDGKYKGTQHDSANFEVALLLALYVTNK